MRIIYLTDIHDAFSNVEKVLQQTQADLYLIAGDLAYNLFPTYASAWSFIELQEYFGKIKKTSSPALNLYKIAQDIIRKDKETSDENRQKAVDYIMMSDDVKRRLRNKYEKLAAIFRKFSGKRIAVIPGNYDLDLDLTALAEWNLHLDSIVCDGLKIAGYGGANVETPGVPDHLSVPFREFFQEGRLVSEPYDFFCLEKPDILLTHQPPFGLMDILSRHGNVGSVGIRNYIDESAPKAVLCGHLHEAWGCRYQKGTFVLNPSNFGRFVEVKRVKKGGYFFDVIIDEGGLQVATLRKLEGRHILDLADYVRTEGMLHELILDEYHVGRLTSQAPRESHIRSISRFRRVKKFFLNHETDTSRHIVRELRLIYRDLQQRGMNVAFDLLGSVNFGIANPGSDIDLIVYLHGQECVPDPNDACGIPQPVQAVFDELKNRHLEIEVCDSLDLDRVKNAITAETLDDAHLQRFAFYRAVCRPVNLRLIKQVENLLRAKPALQKKLESSVREYIRIMISSVRHIYSFKKYQSRLIEKGVKMPPEISELMERYLKEA